LWIEVEVVPETTAIRAGRAFVEIFAEDSQLQRVLARVSVRLTSFGQGLAKIGAGLTGVGTAIVTPFLTAAKVFADVGSELVDMSQRTGASVEALSELAFVADQTGTSLSSLETGIKFLQKNLVAAADGSAEAQESFANLGLSLADLQGLAPDEQFARIADGIAAIEDPAQRTAAVLRVFGRSGTELLPLLSNGAEGIRLLREEARRLGLTMSTEDAQAAETFGDSLATVLAVGRRIAVAIGSAVAPALNDFAQAAARIGATVIRWAESNRELLSTIFKIGAGLTAAGATIIVIGSTIAAAGAVIGALGSGLTLIGTVAAAIVSPLGLAVTAIAALGVAAVQYTENGRAAFEAVRDAVSSFANRMVESFEAVGDALAAGDIALAVRVLWLTIQAEFTRGVGFLKTKWAEFKDAFLALWTEAVFGLARLATEGFAGMQTIWADVTTGMTAAWGLFTSFVTDSWLTAQSALAKGILYIQSLFDDTFELAEALANVDAAIGEKQAANQQQLAGVLADAASRRAARQQEIDQGREGALAEIEAARQRQHFANRRAIDEEIAAAERELSEAEASLAAAREEATRRRSEIAEQATARAARTESGVEAAGDRMSAAGTVNPFAVRGLGFNDELTKAAKDTAKHTGDLARRVGPVVFGF
jgi:hypothetical protein